MASRPPPSDPRRRPPVAPARRLAVLTDVPECTACGSCCFDARREYIGVYGADVARMDPRALAHTEQIGGRRYMRFENGRCSALAIDGARGACACTIHPMRPDACRWLERGSGACREQIDAKRAARDAAFRASSCP